MVGSKLRLANETPGHASQAFSPTKQLEFADDGFCVIPSILSDGELETFRDALDRIARFERDAGWLEHYPYDGQTNSNQRVWNLISRDPAFCMLAEHPVAIEVLQATIGFPALLSSTAANIVNRHQEPEVLHCDQTYMPEPWAAPHGVNIAWCIDDFTADNGATCVVAGSHLLNRSPRPGEQIDGAVPIQAPAGSLIAIDGRCWHHTGSNRTERPRMGIFNWYTLPIYLPQENWYLSLNPAIRQFGSQTLLTMLGFRPEVLGRVNGLDPRSIDRGSEAVPEKGA